MESDWHLEDEEEYAREIVSGWHTNTSTPFIIQVVVIVAIVLCIWAAVRLWRSRDPVRGDGVLALISRSATVVALLGLLSSLWSLVGTLNKIAAMAGAANFADLAGGLSGSIIPVTVAIAAAALLLGTRAVLGYVNDRRRLETTLSP